MDEGLAVYSFWGEDLSIEVYDFVMHFIVTGDDETSFAAAKCLTYIEGCATAVKFSLKVWGDNIITCKKNH